MKLEFETVEVEATPEQLGLLASAVGLVLLAGAVDRLLVTSSDKHALLVLGLAGLAAVGTFATLNRLDLAAGAAGLVAFWSIPHGIPRGELPLAFLPGLFLLIPPGILQRAPRTASAGAAALLAGVGGYLLTDAAGAGLGASALAGLFTWLRPTSPAQATIESMWTGALLLPGVVLVGLAPLNAATEWIQPGSAETALWLGIALLAALALFSLGILGASTLLESSSPGQRNVWLAAAVAAGVLLSCVWLRDLDTLRVGVAQTVLPLAVTTSVAARRLGERFPRARWLALAVPWVLGVVQTPLV